MTLVPWLAGWERAEDPKAFEVALHVGTAAGLLIALRREVGDATRHLDRRRIVLLAGSFGPPAVIGMRLQAPIERRLGTPGTIATGLAAGAAAMLVADRAPQRRRREDAGLLDALLLGLGQAAALMPGVSRNGATLTAARARGFYREDANALSRHVALPVILGATALKLRRGHVPRGERAAFAAGAAASLASTLGSTWLIRQVERDRSLAPYAVYRLALAGLVIRHLRDNRRR